jgi:hypothetical protein
MVVFGCANLCAFQWFYLFNVEPRYLVAHSQQGIASVYSVHVHSVCGGSCLRSNGGFVPWPCMPNIGKDLHERHEAN